VSDAKRSTRSPATGNHTRRDGQLEDLIDSIPHDQVWRESSWRSRLRKRLGNWFAEHARTLPWRSDPQPYRVWISEIMLQQTQVATVLPYFDRFLRSFPSVDDLANAGEDDLLKHWEGLGYYRRARSLHLAAKKIVAEHGGEFPRDFADVIALPGIGRYTAGAILSISGDQKLPILEGNTQRVFSRWVALRQPPTEPPATKLLWHIAERLLPPQGSGRFNQAAMELGALVCLPREPKCDVCPVRRFCRAHLAGLENQIPGQLPKIDYQPRTEFAFVIADRPATPAKAKTEPVRYLMRPLAAGGRWAGLWDFPRPTEQQYASVSAAAKWLSRQLDADVKPGKRLETIRHAVTKYRISLHVHVADAVSTESELPGPWRFVSAAEMTELPMSVTGRKIANLIGRA
jgi:A/G-specific adenine glycosylase